jgi:hypothetical protein
MTTRTTVALLASMLLLSPRPALAGTAENGTDDVDDDGDGSVLVHRYFISSMNSQVWTDFTRDAAYVTNYTTPDDYVHFAGSSANSAIQLSGTLDFGTGQFTVVLRVLGGTGAPACSVGLDAYDGSATTHHFQTFSASAGTKVLDFAAHPVPESSVISNLTVACPGVGTLDLDWLTIQNGPYAWEIGRASCRERVS